MNERRFDGDISRLRSPERLARLEVQRVIDLSLKGSEAKSVIDVGTGSGVFAEAFAARGLKVAGIDLKPEMISVAQEFVPAGHFEIAPAEDIPFSDEAFDLAFLGLVLHETDDAIKALKEAKRVSRRRVIVLEWPYEEGPIGPPLAHRISPDRIEEIFQQAGFSQVYKEHLANLDFYRLELN